MPQWSDLYKIWSLQAKLDPIARKKISKDLEGSGVLSPDAISDIRSSGEFLGGTRGVVRLRDSNDFIDLSSVTNRQSRYKEYERLRTVAEIENAMTVFADEACQLGENGHMFDIVVENEDIKKELEFLFFHPSMINVDEFLWEWARDLFLFGDHFMEMVIDPDEPKLGVLKIQILPPESVYRIETIKGKLIEFQQSKEGPDYNSLSRVEVTKATEAELAQATAIRFAPESIIHFRIGGNRKTFYPYGVSLVEAARGPAHTLRLMEDAMLVYRLVRAPERRIFYIDVGQLPPFKAEAFMDRLKDQFRKKKTFSSKGQSALAPNGASPVEERWQAPSQDEDYWIPLRPNSTTRVETLPGACLSLDTKIPLLDGRTLTLSEIISEYEQGKKLWTYSCNPKTGEIVPGPITWAGVTRKDTDVIKITFDNNESVTCTPDHKFPIINKGMVQAKDLQVGESMIPFNARDAAMGIKGDYKYKQAYDIHERKWKFVHRIVARYLKDSKYENQMLFNEENKYKKKGLIHHKDFDRFNNSPENLVWMNGVDHAQYHSTFMVEKLKDKEFNAYFKKKQKEGWERVKQDKEFYEKFCKTRTKRNYDFWSNPENKKKAFAKESIVYPKVILDFVLFELASDQTIEVIAEKICKNSDFIKILTEANAHIVRDSVDFSKFSDNHIKKMLKRHGHKGVRSARKSVGGFEVKSGRPNIGWPKPVMDEFMRLLKEGCSVTNIILKINGNKSLITLLKDRELKHGFDRNAMNKMLKFFGYKGLSHAKEQVLQYNHKIIKIELCGKVDTGTITIDSKEELHNHHTFALNCGVFTKNSNLDAVDDVLFFRNKLFIALNFPKNYMTQEDPTVTKVTLSSVDVKFAKLVERLQRAIASGLTQIAVRHLELRGFPSTLYDDLMIKLTPPSHHRELSENEVIEARFNRAAAIKGTMMMSDLDILVEILKMPLEKAKEIVARSTIQKLQELKLQIMSQNPQLLGIAMPGSNDQEMGTEPGGPNPELSGQQQPPPQQQPALEGPKGMDSGQGAMDTYGKPKQLQTRPLPKPEPEEISKYDLDIRDFSSEIDIEELDAIELDEN